MFIIKYGSVLFKFHNAFCLHLSRSHDFDPPCKSFSLDLGNTDIALVQLSYCVSSENSDTMGTPHCYYTDI